MILLLLIFIFGAAGSVLRYTITTYIAQITGGNAPAATILINISGSFFAGAIGAMAILSLADPEMIWILGVGFLGGFTTFSTWILQVILQFKNKAYKEAFYNLVISLVMGTLAVYSGFATIISIID
jgi:fluoride exporter